MPASLPAEAHDRSHVLIEKVEQLFRDMLSASRPYIVRLVIRKAGATTAGVSAACTLRPFDELRSTYAQSLQCLVIQFASIVSSHVQHESNPP
jgi:hypothetical protein